MKPLFFGLLCLTSLISAYSIEHYYTNGNDNSLISQETIVYESTIATPNVLKFVRGGGNLVLSYSISLYDNNIACEVADSGAFGVDFSIVDVVQERNAVSFRIRSHMDPELLNARRENDKDRFNALLAQRVDIELDRQEKAVERNIATLKRLQHQLPNKRWTLTVDADPIDGIKPDVRKILKRYVTEGICISVINVAVDPSDKTPALLQKIALQLIFLASTRSPYKIMGVTLNYACDNDTFRAICQFMESKKFVYLRTTDNFRNGWLKPEMET